MPNVIHLELYRPFNYVRGGGINPFAVKSVEAELLFKFELKDGALGALLDSGFELFDGEIHDEIELAAGKYLFIQERALLSRNEILNMLEGIIEHSKRESLKIDSSCYLRYLFEDNKAVTQLFCRLPEALN
ncbi:MAG: hypothetical protein LBG79_03815 [Spirochaetaceae bacterium]|jgi:hypothetical protein|nr:hypothetical protein [Spirochaetaceae bacterium]GMO27888.1 MAG: hypothetical protein Pg6A_15620 [Termitinemataceae bacterium]